MQSRLNLTVTAGFAMFAMFFGSGNLVFPLAIGAETTSQSMPAIIGLALTGVCIPFLGLLSMILFKGDKQAAFSYIGKWPALLLTFAMLSLMGPFGVAARCIIVAYGGVSQLFPFMSLEVFGVVWAIISGLIILRQGGWINVIGRYLTPVLLLSLLVIIVAGLWYAPLTKESNLTGAEAFGVGLDQGYQTMDLLAAFFFSVTVVNYLNKALVGQNTTKILKMSLASSFVGAGLLTLIYIGFVMLGAAYSNELLPIAAEQRLTFIAQQTLGSTAMIIVATAVALACLTTFIVLIVLFAEFLTHEVSCKKIPYKWSVVITLGISYVISLLGFTALAAWIGQALQIAYPALIAFSLALILYRLTKINIIAVAFWGALGIAVVVHFLN